MLLMNLATPDWLNIDCDTPLLEPVLCEKYKSKPQDTLFCIPKKICKGRSIQMNEFCVFFFWWNKAQVHPFKYPKKMCKINQMESARSEIFSVLMQMVSVQSLFFIVSETESEIKIHVSKFFNYNQQKKISTNLSEAQGLFVCQQNPTTTTVSEHIYNLTFGGYISHYFLCDGQKDFADGSDEKSCNCLCEGKNKKYTIKCGPLYYLNFQKECLKHLKPRQIRTKHQSAKFNCNSNESVDNYFLNDLYPDCSSNDEDELFLKSLITNGTQIECAKPEQLPCKQGHPKCYFIHEICSFFIDRFGHLYPCRNGGHIENCKNFNCDSKFKCAFSYCIPSYYICNGQWDCPKGQDETEVMCQSYVRECKRMFKCNFPGRICIHLGNICDGKNDCPNMDDELMCELKCPPSCECLAYAVECRSVNITMTLSDIPSFTSVHIQKSSILDLNLFLNHKSSVMLLAIIENGIETVCHIPFPIELKLIDLHGNNISILDQNCFSCHIYFYLKILKLDFNHIVVLEKNSMWNLTSLVLLNLTGNPFQIVQNFIYLGNSSLIIHIITENIESIDQSVFENVTFKAIVTKQFHFCCFVSSETKCPVKFPWFTSCKDLLENGMLKMVFPVISVTIFVVCAASIIAHFIKSKDREAFAVTITAINVNDILCALYLGSIWIADISFSGQFILHKDRFQASAVCFTGFTIILIFSILSQSFLIFLSFTRMRVVTNPMTTKVKQIKFVVSCILRLSLLATVCSMSTTFLLLFTSGKVHNSFCLPFILIKFNLLILIIIVLVSVSQVASPIVIVLMHIKLVNKYLESQKALHLSKSKTSDDSTLSLILQLVLVTSSNIICWLPSTGVFLSTLILSEYPVEMVLWTTVVFMPVNS